MKQVCRALFALAVLAGSTLTISISMPVTAADRGQLPPSTQPALTVPADLKPLLVGPASEMRLVVTRYQADRVALAGNFAGPTGFGRGGGGRRGGGAGPAAPPAPPVPLSPAWNGPVTRSSCSPTRARALRPMRCAH